MLAALIQFNIPPKMKQGGTKKPAQTARTEENCDKSASVDRYVLQFVEQNKYITRRNNVYLGTLAVMVKFL